jgi:spectinomycin phosphotransferase
MLERPPLHDQRIIAHLWRAYRLRITQVEFLPLGADANTAVYRAATEASAPYFLKLRKGNFEEISLLVPQFLHEQGIRQVIPPHKTTDGRLWTDLGAYTCFLYPYISGGDAFEVRLSADQWIDFGAALKKIHSVTLPPELHRRISTETYSPRWREAVREFQALVERKTYADPAAAEMAAVMRAHRDEIRLMIERAEGLAATLQDHPLERVLCHSDVHAANLLLASDGALYIVDWDNPILAPRERDLMFIGGGVGGIWNTTREEALFYQGYGPEEIDLTALAYYRYERIIQDIAAFCEQILLTDEGGADREQGLGYFASNFSPGGVLEIAWQTDRNRGKGRGMREPGDESPG